MTVIELINILIEKPLNSDIWVMDDCQHVEPEPETVWNDESENYEVVL